MPKETAAKDPFASTSISQEDFQRLGVRPQEFRPSVIRRAAARCSRILAKRQLEKPADHTDVQLTRIATSAYRLMDPRKRANSQQRVHVGRIMPNALTFASRTRFSVGDSDRSDRPITEPFRLKTRTNEDPADVVELATGLDLDNQLSQSLTSDDILQRGWFQNQWLRFKQSRAAVPLALALSVLFVANVYTWYAWRSQTASTETVAASSETVAPTPTVANVPANVPVDAPPLESSVAVKQPMKQAVDVEVAPTDLANNPIVESAKPITETVAVENATVENTEPISVAVPPLPTVAVSKSVDKQPPEPSPPPIPTETDTPSIPLETPPIPTSTDPDSAAPEPAMLADVSPSVKDPADSSTADSSTGDESMAKDAAGESSQPYLDDPFAALASPAHETDPKMETAAPEIVPASKSPVPSTDLADDLRERLTNLVPALSRPIAEDNVSEVIRQLSDLESEQTIGSDDFWVARMMIAEVTWLSGDCDRVVDQLQPLADNYHVALADILTQSYIGAPKFIESEAAHDQRFNNGLNLCERLLIGEQFDLLDSVIDAMQPSLNFFDDPLRRALVRQVDDSGEQMNRLRKSATPALDDPEDSDVSKSTAGIAGRYLCLMRRQWSDGLQWLAKGSDARLANVAQQELELGDDPKPKDVADLGEKWLAVASRMEGRQGESIRLHAIELFQRAMIDAETLLKLELQRLIESEQKELPSYLRSTI